MVTNENQTTNQQVRMAGDIPSLSTYYMYVTAGCNLACRHCWIVPSYEANGGTGQCLDYKLFELAIEQGIPMGLKGVKFTGGEPLLHPDFVRMADHVTEKGVNAWMETNGTLLTAELAKYLKKNTTLQFISISMDGASAKSHDHMRNVPGSFVRAQNGVHYLVEAGYRPQIIMSLYPGNVDEIEALVEWAEKNGCGSVKFNLLQPSGRGEQMKERGEWLEFEELIALGSMVEKKLQKKTRLPLLYSWPAAFHSLGHMVSIPGEKCNIEHILGVLSDGQLAMCGIGTQEPDLIYGKLGEDTVEKVWTSSPGLQKVREVLAGPLEGICSDCLHRPACKASCLAQNYYATKSLTAPFWFCQMAVEHDIFPLARRKKV